MTRFYLIEMYEDGRMKGQSQGKYLQRNKGNLSTVMGRPFKDKKGIIYRPIVEYIANNEKQAMFIIQERGYSFLRGVVFNKPKKKFYFLADFETLKSFIHEFYLQ